MLMHCPDKLVTMPTLGRFGRREQGVRLRAVFARNVGVLRAPVLLGFVENTPEG